MLCITVKVVISLLLIDCTNSSSFSLKIKAEHMLCLEDFGYDPRKEKGYLDTSIALSNCSVSSNLSMTVYCAAYISSCVPTNKLWI